MLQQNLREKINRIVDFSTKENLIIDTLMKYRMSQTVATISKESGLPWSTTAFILQKLQKRGIVFKNHRKTPKKTYYKWRIKRIPASPANTEGFTDEEVEELKKSG